MPTVFAWNLQSLQGPLLFAAIVTFTFTTIRLLILSHRRWRALAKRTPRKSPQEYGKLPEKEQPLFGSQSLPQAVSRWETEIHELGRQIVGQVETKLAVLQTYTQQADRAIGQMESLLERLQRVRQTMEKNKENKEDKEKEVKETKSVTKSILPIKHVESVGVSNVIKATQIEVNRSEELPDNKPVSTKEVVFDVETSIATMEDDFLDTSLRLPVFPPFSFVQDDRSDGSDIAVRPGTVPFTPPPPLPSPDTIPITPTTYPTTATAIPPATTSQISLPTSIPFTSHRITEPKTSKNPPTPRVIRMDSPHILPIRPTPIPVSIPIQPNIRPTGLSLFSGGKSDVELHPTILPAVAPLSVTGLTAKNEFPSGPKPQLASLLVTNE